MKVLIAPDSFKGCLTAHEVCRAIEEGIVKTNQDIQCDSIALSDGGEGFSAIYGELIRAQKQFITVGDRNFSYYKKEDTIILDVASTSGIECFDLTKSILDRSSYSTGILIKALIEKGNNNFIIGLGGSGTNDLGLGILEALGFQFLDRSNQVIQAIPRNFLQIEKIQAPSGLPKLNFQIASDVTNPLLGANGAAQTFAQQKGASTEEMAFLENCAEHLVSITNSNHSNSMGTGAAGGIGFCFQHFFHAAFHSGFRLISNAIDLERIISDVDLVITGEGQYDQTSTQGKIVGEMEAICQKHNTPTLIVCGINKSDETQGIIETSSVAENLEHSMTHAPMLLTKIIKDYFLSYIT